MFFYAQNKSRFKHRLVVELQFFKFNFFQAFNLLHLVVSSYRLYINDLKSIKVNVSQFVMCQFLV